MGGIAAIAKALGYQVSGCDEHVYPPMSTQLEALGITLIQGYDPKQLQPQPDCVIIGNAMRRGNPAVEYVLDHNIPYFSGPEWLYRYVLQNKWVLAVSGTHGKTSTSGMLAWILEYANMSPGFLIGGIPGNFNVSARIGDTPFFVIEADEYDTAFFDKRSKFLHYRPRTLIINNLEFDHADIFDNLTAIQKQFHYMVRAVPQSGLIIYPQSDQAIQSTLQQGCWSEQQTTGENGCWQAIQANHDDSQFTVEMDDTIQGHINWQLIGAHNKANALAAIAAARHVGITPQHAIEALNQFKNAKRRLEFKGTFNGVKVYDDFAHHPTAIATTLSGLRRHVGTEKIYAVVEFGSYTMRNGTHQHTIMQAFIDADEVLIKQHEIKGWDMRHLLEQTTKPIKLFAQTDDIVAYLQKNAKANEHILVMSNKGFDGIFQRLLGMTKITPPCHS
tara:strand:+ start:2042 stop:3376 length:1335 start_codon:yes stop_codon:yes gene_type:complete